jgi:hypothetical protein
LANVRQCASYAPDAPAASVEPSLGIIGVVNTTSHGLPAHADSWAVRLIGDHIGSPHDPEAAKAGYERHNAEVRATIPAHRLLEWRATDGWEPICAALGVPVPDEPFPVTNTTDEFNANIAAGRPPGSN